MSAVALLNATMAGVVAAQTQALRRAVEPLPDKTRKRVANLLRKVMVATDDEEAEELVVSLSELFAQGTNPDGGKSMTLTDWARAAPSIAAAVNRLAADKHRFSENVRARMAETGLSQTALAAKLKVAQPTVAEFLNGKHKPQPQTLHKLAKALRCKVTDLWPGTDRRR